MKYLFFTKTPSNSAAPGGVTTESYDVQLWRPKMTQIKPHDASWFPFFVWWLFHVLRVFKNREYSILLIRKDGHLVHRSCIFPGYFRFPFMNRGDVQVGDTWTVEHEKGKGLATLALRCITNEFADTLVWYVTEESNVPSIKVVKKCDFSLIAEGERTKLFGLGILGSYCITKRLTNAPQNAQNENIS